jgi:hypothetical protein
MLANEVVPIYGLVAQILDFPLQIIHFAPHRYFDNSPAKYETDKPCDSEENREYKICWFWIRPGNSIPNYRESCGKTYDHCTDNSGCSLLIQYAVTSPFKQEVGPVRECAVVE